MKVEPVEEQPTHQDGTGDKMKQLPGFLLIIAAAGLSIGLVVRVVKAAAGLLPPALDDPEFYWRGSVAILLMAGVILLIQIREK
jgi:hypothetical protein